MKRSSNASEGFVENRRRLGEMLPPGAVAVLNSNDLLPTNADGTLLMHPNSDLFYLSGIAQEESILVLAPDAFEGKYREILFLRQPNEHLKIWEGHKLTKADAERTSGIKTVMWLSEFSSVFHLLMCEMKHIYLNSNEHKRAVVDVETRDARFVRDCQRRYPLHDYRRLAPLLHALRMVKNKFELDLIRKACGITRKGFLRVLKKVKPGINECEIEAEFAHEFIRNKAKFAYSPIIASGANSCILHYVQNDQKCRKGDMLLLDVAASYSNYNSDLTRTLPVSGRFTARQKKVYRAVLRILRDMIEATVPGKLIRDWQKEAEALVQEELLKLGLLKPSEIKKQSPERPALKKYFMHGLGHPIGLDVHDVVDVSQPMRPGWVMTIEPGIYIQDEGFGIRLENDVLVTESGAVDLMADIPIDPDEIEGLMK